MFHFPERLQSSPLPPQNTHKEDHTSSALMQGVLGCCPHHGSPMPGWWGCSFIPPLPRLGTSVRAPVGERFPPSSDLGASQQKTPPGEGPNIIASSFYSLPSQAATLSQGQAANQSQAHEDGNQEKSAQRCHFLWERRGCAITGCPITAALCLAGRGGAGKPFLGYSGAPGKPRHAQCKPCARALGIPCLVPQRFPQWLWCFGDATAGSKGFGGAPELIPQSLVMGSSM